MSKPSLIRRFFSAVWNLITRIRLALANIVFLLMLGLIYFVYIGGAQQPLPEKAALLLNMSGTVVDQKSLVDPLAALLGEPSPADHEVLLRDVIESIEIAAEDPAITALVMELDYLVYAGLSKIQEIVPAIELFKATGKPVIAVGDYYTQGQYLLASHADEIISHPMGGVALEGFASYRNYFREALDKVSVNMHVFRAGDHKSAVEPFLRDDMSEEEKEVTRRWLGEMWKQYAVMVEAQRGLPAGSVDDFANNLANYMQGHGGDAAKASLDAGFIDKLMTRSESNDYIAGIVGATDEDGLYEAVVFERYVGRKRPMALSGPEGDRVAVITAEGNIVPGEQPPGTIGGDTLARLIRSTVDAEGVKAIVLRINSGGGSMFASEIIREQVLYARDMGLPVVVSMGTVAASGGYYIAADADEIWATPSTLTGSIGVFAAFPTFEKLLKRVGISTDGVGTTDLAGSLRLDRALSPELVDIIDSGVAFAYRSFLQVVAQGREISLDELDPLAQGRVWGATDALQAGLIDRVGSLEDAIASAAAMANMDDYEVEYVQEPLSARDLFMKQLANRVGDAGPVQRSPVASAAAALMQPVRKAAEELSVLQDPRNLYMRCVSCSLAP